MAVTLNVKASIFQQNAEFYLNINFKLYNFGLGGHILTCGIIHAMEFVDPRFFEVSIVHLKQMSHKDTQLFEDVHQPSDYQARCFY